MKLELTVYTVWVIISALPPYIKRLVSYELLIPVLTYTNLCQYWPGTSYILTYKSNVSSILTYKSTWNQHAHVHPYMWTRIPILIKQVQCTKQVKLDKESTGSTQKNLGLSVVPSLRSVHYWQPSGFWKIYNHFTPFAVYIAWHCVRVHSPARHARTINAHIKHIIIITVDTYCTGTIRILVYIISYMYIPISTKGDVEWAFQLSLLLTLLPKWGDKLTWGCIYYNTMLFNVRYIHILVSNEDTGWPSQSSLSFLTK